MKPTPWYKNFWPWFLISFPLAAIIGCAGLIYMAIGNGPDMVVDDYYKKGKGINIDISKMNVARDLGLNANISSLDNNIVIGFTKGSLTHYPALTATFTHRTLPDRDFTKLVTADASGNYRFTTEDAIQGPWFVELQPHDKQWMIQGKVAFPAVSVSLMK